jgi:hypothetical protein
MNVLQMSLAAASLPEGRDPDMRTLVDLLASEDGRRLLEMRGVLTSEEEFVSSLRPPPRAGLGQHVGETHEASLVYTAHQVMTDYPESVIAKLRAARRIGDRPGVGAVLLWLDMDRAGADKMAAGSIVRGRGGALQIRLASRRHDDKEARFVPLEQEYLDLTRRRIDAWARQHGEAGQRLTRLAEVLRETGPRTLADANMAITSFLLREPLGMAGPSALISDLTDRGLFTETMNDVMTSVGDVVTVFNAATDSLAAADIDPQVHHLRPDYLPLHYSCDRDDRRCTLTRVRRGGDTFAVTRCTCGASYEFHLGSRSLSIDEVASTGRWSTDITLPLYLNDLASGVVAGRSSAIYGMVLNEVIEKVLTRTPIPMLLPPDLVAILAPEAETESLLQRYVEGP